MTIRRAPESFPGRCRRVEHNGVVYVVMTAQDKSVGIAGQTQQCLDGVDALLAEAETDKSKLLTATIYLADMAMKPAMEAVWLAWADRENPCARVCVGAPLSIQADPTNPLLIEIAASAAI